MVKKSIGPEWLYLGVTLKSGKFFNCCVKERIKKFYRGANSILRIDGNTNDTVMLRLLEAYCVPLLTCAIEIVHVANSDERRQLRVAYNSIFRKIFDYRYRESVTKLQQFLGRLTWEDIRTFWQSSPGTCFRLLTNIFICPIEISIPYRS